MQQTFLSDEFQDKFKCKTRHITKCGDERPSQKVIRTLLAYAAALHVFKTKSLGNVNVLMN